jgi:hypothetical protein
MLAFIQRLSRHPVGALGVGITTATGMTVLGFLLLDLWGQFHNPYFAIVGYLILPAIFVVGLLLIPIGGWLERLRRHGRTPEAAMIRVDLTDRFVRRALTLATIFTLANIVIISLSAYRGVEHMDSVEFCGETCHTVMEPEFTAYEGSPHSRVPCVRCHIGPGAPFFVKAKISGIRQVFAVAMKTYSRPIEVPVRNLRPARDTCEGCHWPERFTGDRLVVRTHFAEDSTNTPSYNALVLKVGGGGEHDGHGTGIHWHVGRNNVIEYIANRERSKIPWVRMKDADGSWVEFVSGDTTLSEAEIAAAPKRTMDCLDCHNRPTHTYRLPEEAVDLALAEGRIDRSLPWIRREGVALLRKEYPSRREALDGISAGLRAFYRANDPRVLELQPTAVDAAIRELSSIYSKNVFEHMKVTWGTYPNHLGHQNSPGCFRCHDDNHVAKDGRTIGQDCETCHTVIAMEEASLEAVPEFARPK